MQPSTFNQLRQFCDDRGCRLGGNASFAKMAQHDDLVSTCLGKIALHKNGGKVIVEFVGIIEKYGMEIAGKLGS